MTSVRTKLIGGPYNGMYVEVAKDTPGITVGGKYSTPAAYKRNLQEITIGGYLMHYVEFDTRYAK